ncbi:GNAT family N-acetyltransferase [Paenibacillus selenitireducens]|uniref:GNAT family N-acetyltransferase n=1 Tax=Paenibacillus selenitireducens TaxID=1324314 RepID=A0A1T2X615_9BACL|nr:GNAT family N-acetyltransferase [Paenibacillus selenitireducens]OPA75324.1 GNAT family N-acetyltransferase [Paenibacillus selenitireducens]
MEVYEDLEFQPIFEEDIEQLTEIMTRAFDQDTKQFLGLEKGGPEGYDTGEFLRKWALDSQAQSYKVLLNGKLMGSVIVWINENNENFLGNLYVDPIEHNQGIGLKIWRFIELKYPNTKKWITETPGYSKRNHHFYVNKCGFKIVKIRDPRNLQNECYVLEKEM